MGLEDTIESRLLETIVEMMSKEPVQFEVELTNVDVVVGSAERTIKVRGSIRVIPLPNKSAV